MAVAFRAASSTSSSSITKPTGTVSGDLLLLVGYSSGAASLATPTNFSLVDGRVVGYLTTSTTLVYQRRESFYQYQQTDFGEVLVNTSAIFLNWYPNQTETAPFVSYNSGYRYVLTGSVLTGLTDTRPISVTAYHIWRLFSRVAGGSEPANYTVQSGARWVMAAYSGAHPTNSLDAALIALGGGSSSTMVVPATLPQSADTYRALFVASASLSGTPTLSVSPTPTSRTSLTASQGGFSGRVSLYDQALAGSASAPQLTVSSSPAGYEAYANVLIRPANRAPLAATGITVGGAQNGGQADFDLETVVTADFNDADANDTPSGMAVRRKVGLGSYSYWNGTDWSAGSGFFNATTIPSLTFPAGTFGDNGTTYNVGVRFEDAVGDDGTWSTDIVITGSASPTVTILAPVDVITTGTPTIVGVYDDIEADLMIALEAAVLLAEYATEGFDPATVPAVWRSGRIETTEPTVGVTGSLPDGDYVVAMRVWQEGELASAWATAAFTVDQPPVAIPVISVTDAPEIGAVRLAAALPLNQLTERESDLRHGIETWEAANTNTTPPVGLEGIGMKVTADGPDEIVVSLGRSLETFGNIAYTESAEVALPEGSDVGTWHWEVELLDAEGTVIDTRIGDPVVELPTELTPDEIPAGSGPAGYSIGYDTNPDLLTIRPLQDANPVQGNVYIRLFTPEDAEIDHVEWYHRLGDSGTWLSTPPGRLNDLNPPYDMGTPVVFIPDLGDSGVYGIRARVVMLDGTDEDVIVYFATHVVAEVADATVILRYDTDSAFTNPRPLAAATIASSVDIRAIVDVGTTGKVVDHVEWTWRSGASGTSAAWLTTPPGRVDDINVPYDLGSPYTDPSEFGDTGQYGVRAVVFFTDASTIEASATFTTLVEATEKAGEVNNVEPRLLTNPDVLWVGTFDDTDWKTKWGISSISKEANISLVSPTLTRTGSGKALNVVYRGPGHPDNTSGVGWGFDSRPSLSAMGIGSTRDDIWLKYDWYIPSDWNPYAGGKLPGLGGNDDGSTNLSSGGDYDESSFSNRIMWAGTNASKMITYLYVYALGSQRIINHVNSSNGILYGFDLIFKDPTTGANLLPRRGAWNTLEMHCVMNTPGVSNGTAEYYLNGVRGINATNVQFRSASHPNIHITRMFFCSFYGGPTSNQSTQSMQFDNFVLSTSRVGPRV